MTLLATIWLLIAQTATPPAVAAVSPLVSVWYRGDPAGTPRQDDLAVIRALGFPGVTWPSQHTGGLAELRRQADIVGLVVIVRPEPATPPPAQSREPDPSVDLLVKETAASAIPAQVWRAVARGVRQISFDAGIPTGAGVMDASGDKAAWVPAALAIARQFTFNAPFFRGLRPAGAVIVEAPVPPGVDISLLQDERSWVVIATNTSRQRARPTAKLPVGVPPALWSNLLDGSAMSMLAQPDGARWTVTLEPGEARIYIVNK